jgi:quercetin dioxygenase-like cupin family protein
MSRTVSTVCALIVTALAAVTDPILAQSSRVDDPARLQVSAAIHDSLQWRPCINTNLRGCEVYVIRGVLESGPSEVFIRFAPGATVPRFRHSVNERGLLLEGKLLGTNEQGNQTIITSGTYWYIPTGMIHGGLRCSDERPCLIYESYDGTFDVDIVTQPSNTR